MDLTEFLLERIKEDEEFALGANRRHDSVECGLSGRAAVERPRWRRPRVVGTYDLGISRKRLLAECEAKRRIVEDHIDAWGPNLHTEWGGYMRGGLEFALRRLAAVYDDHPDYDEAWAT